MAGSGDQIIEEDDTGQVCRRYTPALAEIPVANSRHMTRNVRQLLTDVFMPAGFPGSVSSDYLEYQFYDSLQAFASSIAGLLASRAVLEGVGVGDANASATHALLLTIAQDAIGRLATILFAWRIGTALEPEAKRYRLLADIFNDGAMIIDCLSPALPAYARIFCLCTSGLLRALCGVAAGGAKAALSVHFARANNVGDLNAKDSSQETVIGLFGMLTGSYVISRVTSQVATWTLLLILLMIHISTNYLAVRAVVMRTLSRQRLNIAYECFRNRKVVPSPREVSKSERIFASGAVLRGYVDVAGRTHRLGQCEIGVPLSRVPPTAHGLLDVFLSEQYLLWFAASPGRFNATHRDYVICLKKGAQGSDLIKAWIHAIELAHMVLQASGPYPHLPELLAESLQRVNAFFPEFVQDMARSGWDIHNPGLITKPSFRISVVAAETDTKKRD